MHSYNFGTNINAQNKQLGAVHSPINHDLFMATKSRLELPCCPYAHINCTL